MVVEKLLKAREHLQNLEFEPAFLLGQEIIAAEPDNGDALALLARLSMESGTYLKALQYLEQARAAGHASVEADAVEARCLFMQANRERAVALAKQVAETGSDDGAVLNMAATVLSGTGNHAQAVGLYEKATQLDDTKYGYFYNLGAALQIMGRFDDARAAFDRCLKLKPGYANALIGRTLITKQTQKDNDLESLVTAWNNRDPKDVDTGLQIAHAIAKLYEDLGQYDRVVPSLALGKSIKIATIPNRNDEDMACFDAAEETARELNIASGTPADGPIIITGMPRSGTTLTDRIISSHSQVTSAGELGDFSMHLRNAAGGLGRFEIDSRIIRAAKTVDLGAVGEAYLNSVRDILEIEGRFTDKMPLNFMLVPAMLAALPTSRIIFMRRSPADTLISNFRQVFSSEHPNYTYTLQLNDTANHVIRLHQLIKVYEEHLPADRFRVVDYESIVDDQESRTRELLDFCGLEFEQACLDFHQNDAPIATASATQARQPIFRSSLDRWKRYRPGVDPGLRILKEAGLLDEAL